VLQNIKCGTFELVSSDRTLPTTRSDILRRYASTKSVAAIDCNIANNDTKPVLFDILKCLLPSLEEKIKAFMPCGNQEQSKQRQPPIKQWFVGDNDTNICEAS
jgi:hypothetical protein